MYPVIKHINLSERAKAFWERKDIDDVFDVIFAYLDYLKRVLKKNTATDRGSTLSVFRDYDQNAYANVFMFKTPCFSIRIYSGPEAAGDPGLFRL